MATFDPPLARCLLCASDAIHEYHRDANNVAIFRCSTCGVQFMNPQYTDRHLVDYYAGYTQDEPQWNEPLAYGHNVYLQLLERYLPAKGKLLDIGAGHGHLLCAALERGWDASGYEVDDSLAASLTKKLGTEVRSGDFTTLDWPRRAFDAIVMHHVLEHLKNPPAYLRTIQDLLRGEGILFLVLPNIHSLSSLMKFLLERLHLRTRNVGAYYDTSHHLWYFTPTTLRRLLLRSGFEILYTRSGHRVRPGQTRFRRFIMRNITERNLWHSTFLCVARKRTPSAIGRS